VSTTTLVSYYKNVFNKIFLKISTENVKTGLQIPFGPAYRCYGKHNTHKQFPEHNEEAKE